MTSLIDALKAMAAGEAAQQDEEGEQQVAGLLVRVQDQELHQTQNNHADVRRGKLFTGLLTGIALVLAVVGKIYSLGEAYRWMVPLVLGLAFLVLFIVHLIEWNRCEEQVRHIKAGIEAEAELGGTFFKTYTPSVDFGRFKLTKVEAIVFVADCLFFGILLTFFFS